MTQQTKTVEMVARECAEKIQRLVENVVGGYDTGDESMEGIIRQAISDAVKGTGAVEQMEKITAWLDKLAKGSDEQAAANRGRFESLVIACTADAKNYRATKDKIMPSLTALKALELPDHAERGTKPVIGKGTKQI